MRLLLDSHYAFWLTLKRSQLSSAEFSALTDSANQLFVSCVSIWELRIKWESRFVSGMRKGEANPTDVLQLVRWLEIPVVDLTPDHAAASLRYPMAHKDPFDEQLLIHAQELGLLLFTRDADLVGHPQTYTLEG